MEFFTVGGWLLAMCALGQIYRERRASEAIITAMHAAHEAVNEQLLEQEAQLQEMAQQRDDFAGEANDLEQRLYGYTYAENADLEAICTHITRGDKDLAMSELLNLAAHRGAFLPARAH